MCVQLYSPTHWDRCPASQSTGLHPVGRGGPRLFRGPRYRRASLGSLGRPQQVITQCQAQSLHRWCRMCCRQGWEGTPKACWTSTYFPFTTPAKSSFPFVYSSPFPISFSTLPPLLNPHSLFPFLFVTLSLFASSILELLWFRSLSFPSSILRAPAILQPTTVSYWFIDCCLPVGERPQSPSALPCMDLSSLSHPFFSRSPSSPSPSPHQCSSSETRIRESRGVQFTQRSWTHPLLHSFLLSLPPFPSLTLTSLSPPFSAVLLSSDHFVGRIFALMLLQTSINAALSIKKYI